ncbi:hypothetical protein ACN42_g3677 [Penicillium freii]|uniref:Uncharacterized protein n=1 Tax=Penicillium freii TaxID=48697 RepID=A0A101MMR8_PENFR|nr:hypothetical protein ACN42_g3677 [Penicillium freii]
MTREKKQKGNLPRSGVTAVPCVKSKGKKIPFSPTQLSPSSSFFPFSSINISLFLFFLNKAFALAFHCLCEKFPDLPGSSVLEPFEPFQYGRQHVFDPLSPGMPRLIRSAFYL